MSELYRGWVEVAEMRPYLTRTIRSSMSQATVPSFARTKVKGCCGSSKGKKPRPSSMLTCGGSRSGKPRKRLSRTVPEKRTAS